MTGRTGQRIGGATERGFTLWEMALVVTLLGVAMVIGVSAVRAPIHELQTVDQQRLLHWADKQIMAFAQINGRLPCPDRNGDGLEDCGAGGTKGWLPYKTLGFQSTMPGRGVPHLKYVAYSGLNEDLTVTSATRYQPIELNGNNTSWTNGSHYTGTGFDNANDLDLCNALENDAKATPSASAANYSAGGVVHNVAYGIAASGGGGLQVGSLFEGLNAQNSASMESPGHAPDSGYNDQVLVRTFASMRKALSCESVVQSVNTVGMSVGVLDDIKSQRQSMISSTNVALGLTILGDAIQVAELADSIAALGAAIKEEAVAASLLAGSIATCAASLGISPTCELIPVYATAVGFATAAIATAGVAVGLNGLALIPLGVATGYVVAADIELNGSSTITPLSGKASQDYWAAQQKRYTDLKSEVSTLQTKVNNESAHVSALRSKIITEAEKYRYTYTTKTVTDSKGNKKTVTVRHNHDPCYDSKGNPVDCTPGPILSAALTAAVNDAQANQNYANSSSSTDASQCDQLPATNTVDSTSLGGKVTSGSLGSGANGAIGSNMQYLDPTWIQGKFNTAFNSSGGGTLSKTSRQRCLDQLAHTTALKTAWDNAKVTFSDSVTAVNAHYKYPAYDWVCVQNIHDAYNDSYYYPGFCDPISRPGHNQTLLQADLNNYEQSYFQYLSDKYTLDQKKQDLNHLKTMLDNQGGAGSTKTGTQVSIYTSGYLQILKNVDARGAIK